jgi:hypothetical protein
MNFPMACYVLPASVDDSRLQSKRLLQKFWRAALGATQEKLNSE